MCQIKKLLPVQALMAILEDRETTSMYLRMEVASTLAFTKAEESLDLVLRLIQDPDEEVCLREMLVESLATWGERISDDLLLTLLLAKSTVFPPFSKVNMRHISCTK